MDLMSIYMFKLIPKPRNKSTSINEHTLIYD